MREKTTRTVEALRYLGFDSVADDLAEDDSAAMRDVIAARVAKLGGEGWSGTGDAIRLVEGEPVETIPAAYVGEAMRGEVEEIGQLLTAASDPASMEVDALNECDVSAEFDDHELQNEVEVIANAEERLDSYALCVEETTTFEIVTGVGGPDTRFLIECDVDGNDGEGRVYEIRRVGFRYSWSGSSETWFSGSAADVVKDYACRLVPELIR